MTPDDARTLLIGSIYAALHQGLFATTSKSEPA